MKPKIIEFDGFESLHDFDETMMWAVQEYMESFKIPAEFLGTLRISIRYIPEED